MEKVRVDKWLWSVRIFKSRTLATNYCKTGRVTINGTKAKPSSMVSQGDRLVVDKNGYKFQFAVLKLLAKRVGAPIAVLAYNDLTPEEELNKYESWFVGKAQPEVRDKGSGRPTKRDRRDLDIYKTGFYFDE